MVKFNPFPDAKKGIRRMIQKKPMTKKTTSWSSVPYVKDNKGVAARFRLRQTKWRRTIQELVTASDEEIISILIKDQLLRDWKGAMCPHCQSGKLSALTNNGRDDILRHRCNRKGCQRYLLPQHLHPIFSATKGPEGHTLQMQAAALLVRLLHVPLSAIHVLTHINHKALEKMSRNLMITRKGYVQKEEKNIVFGGAPRSWKDVEADEATFDKKALLPHEMPAQDGKTVVWEQWGAMAPPRLLVLCKLNPARTVPRAPGPGAIRKTDWSPLANKFLAKRNVILHTDSARSYRMKLPGVLHDAVVHKKRRVKVNGKWVEKTHIRAYFQAQVARWPKGDLQSRDSDRRPGLAID